MLQTAPMPASNQFPSYFLSLISVKDRLLLQGNDCIPFFPSVIVNDTYHISWHQLNEFEEFLLDRPNLALFWLIEAVKIMKLPIWEFWHLK